MYPRHIALFAILCALGGTLSAPVPSPAGLLDGLLPLAPAPSSSADSTPLNLKILLNELHIALPEGLGATLSGIDLGGLNEVDLAQIINEVLSLPGVQVPAGTDATEVVNAIVEDVESRAAGLKSAASPSSSFKLKTKRGLLSNLNFFGSPSGGSSPTPTSLATPQNTDLVGGIINLSDVGSAFNSQQQQQNDHGATPTAASNHFLGLPEAIDLSPYVKVSPSLTLEIAPTGTGSARGPVGLLNAGVSADVDLLGAKFTLGPIVNV
ncbi:hypothetical protein IAU59_002437 [Kwoniella sp. CBS 9459]